MALPMKILLMGVGVFLSAGVWASAQTNDLDLWMQRGTFQEQALKDLPLAAQSYQHVLADYEHDRELAATALFRLGECYRLEGNTNLANTQYERLIKEF